MRSVTLLIDKRLELSTKYKKLLETTNNSVLVSKDIVSAMKIIQDTEPDLIIISDSVDSDLSDYCKKIRALTYNMRPVIIATSKSDNIDDKLNVLQNGADDYISEPVNIEEFVMRVKAHLRREMESNLENFLPNKNSSLRALKRIIKTENPWAALLISIDNLENYKESYTELASDKLLKTFSAIIQSALNENDYFGTISNNELLILTDMYKADKIANYLTFAFDTVVPKFYSPQDLSRGYIIMQGDEYVGRKSEFMHITIGAVTNEYNKFDNVTQLINKLVQTKNMAHMPLKSNYLFECPKISAENSVIEKEFNNKIAIIEPDESMYLLIKTILELQGFKVVNAEDMPAVIIIDDSQNGLELCKNFKQESSTNKIIVTSVSHDKETVLNCGADIYIPKPYEVSQLVKWIEVFVREFNQ